jgi:hypothetical protein
MVTSKSFGEHMAGELAVAVAAPSTLQLICGRVQSSAPLLDIHSDDPRVKASISEMRYSIQFSGTPAFKSINSHVCTGYLPAWNWKRAHALRATRWWYYDNHIGKDASVFMRTDAVPWFADSILECTPEYIATDWQGREGTAELEMLTGLLPLRHPRELLACAQDPVLTPIEFAIRARVTGNTNGGPWRDDGGYSPMDGTAWHSQAGWCMWFLARRAGIQFPEFSWTSSRLPLAGCVLRDSLAARFKKRDIEECVRVFNQQAPVRTAYAVRTRRTYAAITDVLQKYVNDGYELPKTALRSNEMY